MSIEFKFVSTPQGEIAEADLRTAKEWGEALDSNPRLHGGDHSWTENGGILLAAFTKGRDYVMKKADERE